MNNSRYNGKPTYSPIGRCSSKATDTSMTNLLTPSKCNQSFLSSTRITPIRTTPRYALSKPVNAKSKTPNLSHYNSNSTFYSPNKVNTSTVTESRENSLTPTHQAKYGRVGLFPVVHFFQKKLPLITPKQNSCVIKLSSNGPGLFEDTVYESGNTVSTSQMTEASTRSVLDALKEISRKRIHGNESYDKEKEKTSNEYTKRTRDEDTSMSPKSSTSPQQAPKRICVVDPIYASNTSSLCLKNNKRKLYNAWIPVNEQKSKKVMTVETQTQTIEDPNSAVASTIPEKATSTSELPPVATSSKDSQTSNANCIDEIPEKDENAAATITAAHRAWDEKIYAIQKKNKLAIVLSRINGEEPKLIPVPRLWDKSNDSIDSTIAVSVIQTSSDPLLPTKDHQPESTVTFGFMNKTTSSTTTTASIVTPIASVSQTVTVPKFVDGGTSVSTSSIASSYVTLSTTTSSISSPASTTSIAVVGNSFMPKLATSITADVNLEPTTTPTTVSSPFKLDMGKAAATTTTALGTAFARPKLGSALSATAGTTMFFKPGVAGTDESKPTAIVSNFTSIPSTVVASSFAFTPPKTDNSTTSVVIASATSPAFGTTTTTPAFGVTSTTSASPQFAFTKPVSSAPSPTGGFSFKPQQTLPTAAPASTTASLFTGGVTAATTSIFGNTANAKPMGFGTGLNSSGFSTTTTTTSSSGFGTPAVTTTASGFGGTGTTSTGFGGIGTTLTGFGATTTTSPSAFGSTRTTPSAFGGTATTPSGFGGTGSTSSGFGVTTTTPTAFGTTTPSSTFGSNTTNTAFGSPATAVSSFVTSAPPPSYGSTTTTSAFGNPNFGAVATTTASAPSAFGPSAGGFGSTGNGFSKTPITTTSTNNFDSGFVTGNSFGSTAAKPTAGFSFAGSSFAGGANSITSTPSAFGGTTTTAPAFGTTTNSPPAFGAAINAPPGFGAATTTTYSSFGNTSGGFGGFGSGGTSFGTSAPGTFGASGTPAFGTSTAPPPAYNATTATTTSVFAFGTNAPNKTVGSGFGSSSTGNTAGFTFNSPTAVTTTTASSFGSAGSNSSVFSFGSNPPAPTTTASGFGFSAQNSSSTTSPPPPTFGSSGFGSSGNPPAFGTTPTTQASGFGAAAPNVNPFGKTNPPAFSANTTPAFGATSTQPPAFGATSPGFGNFPQIPTAAIPTGNNFNSSFGNSTTNPANTTFGFGSSSSNNNATGFGTAGGFGSGNNNNFATPTTNNTFSFKSAQSPPDPTKPVFAFGQQEAPKPAPGGFNFTSAPQTAAANFGGGFSAAPTIPQQPGMFNIGASSAPTKRVHLRAKRRT